MSGQKKDSSSSGASRSHEDLEQVGVLTRLSDGKEFPLGFGSMRVGRQRRADLVITDKTVSRHHSDVIYESGRYVLYDHSTNGTWVNGNLVAVAQPLRDRDTVKFGKAEFVFSTKSVPTEQALRSGEITAPKRVPGSSTVFMRGGKGKRPRIKKPELTDRQARSIAWRVAMSIKEKGTKPRFYMRETVHNLKPLVLPEIRKAMIKADRRAGRGPAAGSVEARLGAMRDAL